jgi:hypothetical protein
VPVPLMIETSDHSRSFIEFAQVAVDMETFGLECIVLYWPSRRSPKYVRKLLSSIYGYPGRESGMSFYSDLRELS